MFYAGLYGPEVFPSRYFPNFLGFNWVCFVLFLDTLSVHHPSICPPHSVNPCSLRIFWAQLGMFCSVLGYFLCPSSMCLSSSFCLSWWCHIAMQTYPSAFTLYETCVDNLSTVQDGWGKSSEWVKWHGWQYQADQDPNYMPNSTFWGWRWCRIAMWTCVTVPLHCVDDLSTIHS